MVENGAPLIFPAFYESPRKSTKVAGCDTLWELEADGRRGRLATEINVAMVPRCPLRGGRGDTTD